MTRKKSRKIGQIGIPKATSPRVVKTEGRIRTKTGNKPGTRQKLTEVNPASQNKNQKDHKFGSKIAVDLSKYKTGAETTNKPKKQESQAVIYKTPQAELDAIENDKELEALLEKQDNKTLSASEQAYVDKKTSRYRELCELMGIDVDEYNDDAVDEAGQEDDPFAKLDAIKLEDFKD